MSIFLARSPSRPLHGSRGVHIDRLDGKPRERHRCRPVGGRDLRARALCLGDPSEVPSLPRDQVSRFSEIQSGRRFPWDVRVVPSLFSGRPPSL